MAAILKNATPCLKMPSEGTEKHCQLPFSDMNTGKVGLGVNNNCLICHPNNATLQYPSKKAWPFTHLLLIELKMQVSVNVCVTGIFVN